MNSNISAKNPGSCEKWRVLVVDDEKAILDLLSRALSVWGYSVTTCPDVACALKELSGGEFHAVITDWQMPCIGGHELVRWIRRHCPEIVILVITGVIREKMLEICRKLGVFKVIQKPCVYHELKNALGAELPVAKEELTPYIKTAMPAPIDDYGDHREISNPDF